MKISEKQKEVIAFLEAAFTKIGEHKLWILKDICNHHDIVMTNEWDREKNCPVFAKREIKGSAKELVTLNMMNGRWENGNDGAWL